MALPIEDYAMIGDREAAAKGGIAAMRFAKWLFAIAGIYGVVLIAPMYFSEAQLAHSDPPAVTHPEYFYGFIGVTLAWQLAFLLIARDPGRYRPIMPAAVAEKASYGVAAVTLFFQHRVSALILGFGCIDLLLGALFLAAFHITRRAGGRDLAEKVP